jgi:cold-inducible RNA-binding protein
VDNRLYVGNLPWETDDMELRSLFEEACGANSVEEVSVMIDRQTRRSRGFGFVTMVSSELATKAIQTFEGKKYKGRPLKVDRAAEPSSNRRNERYAGNNERSGNGFKSRRDNRYDSGNSSY